MTTVYIPTQTQKNQRHMEVVVVAMVVVIFSQETSSGDKSAIDCGNCVTESYTIYYFIYHKYCNSLLKQLILINY